MHVLSASSISGTLTGNQVVNPAGEDIGHVKDLMIDLQHGRVAYAVLSFGGVFGFGDKLFAVPFEALALDTAKERFTLDVSKDTLERAKGFDQNDWPDFADPMFHQRTYEAYGHAPYWS